MVERDGDGYLLDMNAWTEEVMYEMAKQDDFQLTESMVEQIMKAREYYDENATVPPIRKFAKYAGMDQKEMFKEWMTGPMKPITKYGGLPKPTGCV
jgi:TusE/DsrC/DsvC family sulfur relay protein